MLRSIVEGLANRARLLVSLLRGGRYRAVLGALRQRLYSDTTAIGLRRDLDVAFAAPHAKIPLAVRPLETSDVDPLLAVDEGEATDELIVLRDLQTWLLREGLGTCYVAVDEAGRPCYMQLLIGAGENEHVQRYFRGLMPMLAADEALLEGAYTPPQHRGQGIMSAAMALVAERAAAAGARYVITFVNEDNLPSLKGCRRAGFTPFVRRTKRHRLFRRTVTFEPLASETPVAAPA